MWSEASYRCMMPMEDSLCLMRPTLPSLFLLCWTDTLQICTTTSHSSLAVRRLSLGPGSSLHVEAKSCPSYQEEAQETSSTRETTAVLTFTSWTCLFTIYTSITPLLSLCFLHLLPASCVSHCKEIGATIWCRKLFCVPKPNMFFSGFKTETNEETFV